MAAYSRRRETAVKIKGFWDSFKRTKRGVIGLVVICLSVVIALFGPMFTTLDALYPQWPGYYPAGPIPACHELSVPIWYRYLPGGDEYSENTEIMSDYRFTTSEVFNTEWRQETSNDLVNVAYSPVHGSQEDGCVKVSYQRSSGLPAPVNNRLNMSYDFRYPFKNPPRSFWIHSSYFIEGTVSKNLTVSMRLAFYRKDTQLLANYAYNKYKNLIFTQDSLTIYKYPLVTHPLIYDVVEWRHIWTRMTHPDIFLDEKYYLNPEKVIFPAAGNYTLTVEVDFQDKGENAKDVTVYLDNINLLFYGDAFGLLGSDGMGGQARDIFTALLHGAQISVFVGLFTATISVAIGLLLGLTAGYLGGYADEGIMRFADFLIGLPGLPLLIVLAVILSPSVWNIVLILSLMGWMGFSRSIRSMTLSLRERSFVEAAKASGASRSRILFRHLLPNVIPLVYLALATSVPGAIVAEASLSFLGLFDPTRITWGRMLNEFTNSGVAMTKGFERYWFWVLPPGIGISLLAISFIMIGYSLDEILNPKLRQRR